MDTKTIKKVQKKMAQDLRWRGDKLVRNPNGKRRASDMRKVRKSMGLI